jgi:hypothetical protein
MARAIYPINLADVKGKVRIGQYGGFSPTAKAQGRWAHVMAVRKEKRQGRGRRCLEDFRLDFFS